MGRLTRVLVLKASWLGCSVASGKALPALWAGGDSHWHISMYYNAEALKDEAFFEATLSPSS